jgi:PAS domain S-box-containing protein
MPLPYLRRTAAVSAPLPDPGVRSPLQKALPLMTGPTPRSELELLSSRLAMLRESLDEMDSLLARYKASREALHQSEQQLRLLVEGVTEYAIFMLDTSGHILSWNSGAQRIKGYTISEIIGRHFSIFYLPEDIADDKPSRELVIATAEGRYAEEGWRVRRDGAVFWANVLITALFDGHGKLQGFAKVTRDMTERKQAEEQRDQLREQELQLLREREGRARAEALNQLRQEFLTIVAHELRTPVTSLLGYAELLGRRIERGRITPENLQQPVRTIVEQGRRLERLTAMLLDVTRFEGDHLLLTPTPLDVVELLQRVLRGLSILAEHHTLEVRQLDHPVMILGDELRLEQVFYNLLHNAIKYSPAGTTISVAMQADEARFSIAVTDQGVGVPTDDLPHIFERFYRAANVNSAHTAGMGIGLYLVKEIVGLHGGSITVQSELGAGSTFTVSLPVHIG